MHSVISLHAIKRRKGILGYDIPMVYNDLTSLTANVRQNFSLWGEKETTRYYYMLHLYSHYFLSRCKMPLVKKNRLKMLPFVS